jgi:CRISPR-associated protein Csb2
VSFAIVADLPLGTYRGAGADGRPERVPSVARLHSALLCAAGFGPRATEHDPGTLDVQDADASALRWIEENPPDSVHIPALAINAGRAIAHRDDGTLHNATIKKLPKAPDTATAVEGTFAWIWSDPPPQPVRSVLEALCPDVAYLGTTESPVRLSAVTVDDLSATHRLDQAAGLFTAGAMGVERAAPGRLEELSDAYRAHVGQPPSAARDRPGTDEKSLSPVPVRRAVETAWYTPVTTPPGDVPWPQVLVIPAERAIPAQQRVGWAVAAHRALINLIGPGAPSLVTGTYEEGARRPANRLALHFLGDAEWGEPCLIMLVPAGADAADLDVLGRAAAKLTSVRGPQGRVLRLSPGKLQMKDGSGFWAGPRPGHLRLWQTVPAAVPDTRGTRESSWNFAHAALLSVAFVWKDLLPAKVHGRGPEYHRGLARAASEGGAAVVHVAAIRTVRVERYVHKVNEHAVVRPYQAYLSLGDLAGPGTIAAIGQSRHLGGGLLVPFDVPEA